MEIWGLVGILVVMWLAISGVVLARFVRESVRELSEKQRESEMRWETQFRDVTAASWCQQRALEELQKGMATLTDDKKFFEMWKARLLRESN